MPNSSHAQLLQTALEHHQAGRLSDALKLYGRILIADPHHAPSLHWTGVLAGQTGQLEAAVDLIQRAIAIDASVAIFHANLGKFLMDLGNATAAAIACRNALALQPDLAEAHNNLGNALRALGHTQEAITCFEKATALNREYAVAHYNLGNVLQDEQRLDESVASYQKALSLKQDMVKTHNNMGIALAELGRDNEAEACYRRALEILPDYAETHWNLALLLLERGDLQLGWKEFEWRCRQMSKDRGFPQPHWDGTLVPDKTVLLYTVGGFGDALHWVRLVEHVRPRAGRIILECPPPLFSLFAQMHVADEVISRGDPLPPFDFHGPLQSLNGMLNISLETIPNKVPYLHAPDDRRRRLKGRVPKDGLLNVGLVWAGSTSDPRLRSGTLDVYEPLAHIPGVRFYSLQKGPASQDPRPAGLDLIDFTPDLQDFADTAALVEQLDLVITVDTSMAHLAGGLGKPVWVLIPKLSDFRWLRERTDSPWYPTMRLFRQQTPGEWSPVIAAIASAMAETATKKRTSMP